MQAKRQPFISENSIRRTLAKAKRLNDTVTVELLQRAIDKIEQSRQWHRQRASK